MHCYHINCMCLLMFSACYRLHIPNQPETVISSHFFTNANQLLRNLVLTINNVTHRPAVHFLVFTARQHSYTERCNYSHGPHSTRHSEAPVCCVFRISEPTTSINTINMNKDKPILWWEKCSTGIVLHCGVYGIRLVWIFSEDDTSNDNEDGRKRRSIFSAFGYCIFENLPDKAKTYLIIFHYPRNTSRWLRMTWMAI